MSFLSELKRRNVLRVGVAYIFAAWLIIQVAETIFPLFGFGDTPARLVVIVLSIGCIPSLIFSWVFEITPEGLKKDADVDREKSITQHTGKKLDRIILVVLVLALAYFAFDKFVLDPVEDEQIAQSAREEGRTAALTESYGDKSIAVLPFENHSNLDEDEFFVSGIHDDLLTQLANISSLRVISRKSVSQFNETTKSISEIAELLSVATILEGGVQRAGSQVRINMQLIDAATDTHLWAQTYDRELTAKNIFFIQGEIATAVTEAMLATFSREEQQRTSSVPTENMQALEEYFKARSEMDQRTLPAIESSRMRFEHARQLDPNFALAYSGEAQAIMLLADSGSTYGNIPIEETHRLARPLLERALELAPQNAQVLGALGLLESRSFNYELALDYYERSLTLNPSSGEVLNWQRMALLGAGRIKDAMETSLRMVEINPMSKITLFNGVTNLSIVDDYDKLTIEMMLQRLENLDQSYGFEARGIVEQNRGNILAALRYYYMSLEMNPGRSTNLNQLAELLARMGFADEARLVAPGKAGSIAFWMADWDTAILLAREELEKDPNSIFASWGLFNVLVWSGDAENAYPLANQLWERNDGDPFKLGSTAIEMAWTAKQTDHTQQMQLYRQAGTKWLQARIESGLIESYTDFYEAFLAALDGRINDVNTAIKKFIDHGGRGQNLWMHPVFDRLQDNASYQAQINRLANLANSEREEILAMLCGPETILRSWEPASETCGMYRQ